MRPINLIAVICGILACLVWLSDSRAGDFKKWRIGAAGKASFVGGGTAGSIDSDFGSWDMFVTPGTRCQYKTPKISYH